MTWRARAVREILTGAGYGALVEDIVAAVDATWPAQPGSELAPAPSAPPAKTPPEERELLTIKQLVAYSALSERTLRGYLRRRSKPLPHYRVNKKILIRKVQFDEWLAHFRPVEPVDEIAQAVDEMLTGLTGPRPLADTRRHHTRRR